MSDVGSSEHERTFYQLNTDGGIVAEPGQAAGEASIGAVLKSPDGSVVHDLSVRIGWATDHHVAEYRALIAGLRLPRGHGVDYIRVFSDSAFVVNQVNGETRVKRDYLDLCAEARALFREFAKIAISHVDRKDNAEAHALADRALGAIRSPSPHHRPNPLSRQAATSADGEIVRLWLLELLTIVERMVEQTPGLTAREPSPSGE